MILILIQANEFNDGCSLASFKDIYAICYMNEFNETTFFHNGWLLILFKPINLMMAVACSLASFIEMPFVMCKLMLFVICISSRIKHISQLLKWLVVVDVQ